MNLTDWPEGFTRGVPNEEGYYACIVDKSDEYGVCYAIENVDVEYFGKICADEIGIEPGLAVVDIEGASTSVENYGIIGYHRICESSWDVTSSDGFKGETTYLKLNKAGIDFYIAYYRRELEKIRVVEWRDGDTPPAPRPLPPMPVYSRSFFDEADE